MPDGVIVELESLTLSRGIPMGMGMILEPMINRIARESVTRTLASVRRLYWDRSGSHGKPAVSVTCGTDFGAVTGFNDVLDVSPIWSRGASAEADAVPPYRRDAPVPPGPGES